MRTAADDRQFARDLRNSATPDERALWQLLSRVRPRFTRQLRIGPFVGDFACRRGRLLVELDGSQHVDSRSDVGRTCYLERNGWRVIRFWNSDVQQNSDGVLQIILAEMTIRLPAGEAVQFIVSRSGRERVPRSRKKNHP